MNDCRTPIEIALGIDEEGMTTAKRLYSFLELNPSNYSKWCRINIVENEFADENIDYWAFVLNDERNFNPNPTTDYKLTAHFAKKLSMKGHGERAEQAREYFSMVEERAKQLSINKSALSPQTVALLDLVNGMARQEIEQKRHAERISRIEQKQDTMLETFSATADIDDFKVWVNRCIGKIAESPKYTNGTNRSIKYQNARSESYDRLNQKRPCRLTQRVAYAKETALQNGSTKTAANAINRLTVICSDKDLKPIYETVIKEMMMCYCIE